MKPQPTSRMVGLYVAGVLLASWLHHDNLVGPMSTGRKPGRPEDGVRSAWRSVGVLMLVAVLGFWWTQWQGAPTGSAGSPAAVFGKAAGQDRDDD
jgi:hypothetical protein